MKEKQQKKKRSTKLLTQAEKCGTISKVEVERVSTKVSITHLKTSK